MMKTDYMIRIKPDKNGNVVYGNIAINPSKPLDYIAIDYNHDIHFFNQGKTKISTPSEIFCNKVALR